MTTQSPRQKRHEKSQQSILDVAAKLIGEHGYENLSLREVARQADYSPAALYEYFKSKEDILFALSEQIGLQMLELMNEAPASLPPYERITQLGQIYIRFAISHPEKFQLMNSLSSRRRSLAEPISATSPYNLVLDAVKAAIKSSDIKLPRGAHAEEITYSLWAIIHGISMLRLTYLRDFQADFEKIDLMALKTFLKGLQ
ncbi:MAG: TetR/AcrR family transcriptional regulator [Chloroflexi bacterium]|nr:TetR/AcrR family transcriptional regulator [Chloroflexota bacterium]